ncbi:hypothetical protein ACWOFR_03295 [Carnobacterium gallinarum]|uniref:hypothetical protein n=1 Tax=Carnobacterium gallinarum TaxID=2749 RepID=UPI000690BA5E|nr:hypothetical protein [Carnobacterium gallinarum]
MTKKDETIKAVEAKNAISEVEKRPLKKFGKQETIEIEGIEYTFQFPGIRKAQQILDSSKMLNGVISDEAYNHQLMETVIVEPKTNWDYWDENSGYREVMALADNFLGRMFN